MNNEPVAWIDKVTGKPKMIGYIFADYDIPLYLHPAKTEEFVAGDAICPSCGCKSLYKTARSEWCVTHKCLWQKDYELTLTDEEIMECKAHVEVMYGCLAPLEFAWLILKKASEK